MSSHSFSGALNKPKFWRDHQIIVHGLYIQRPSIHTRQVGPSLFSLLLWSSRSTRSLPPPSTSSSPKIVARRRWRSSTYGQICRSRGHTAGLGHIRRQVELGGGRSPPAGSPVPSASLAPGPPPSTACFFSSVRGTRTEGGRAYRESMRVRWRWGRLVLFE